MTSPPPSAFLAAETPRKKTNQMNENDLKFFSSFSPSLIHRVLMTDPADSHKLTANGVPRVSHTPSYNEFLQLYEFVQSGDIPQSLPDILDHSEEDHVAKFTDRIAITIKKVYHDNIKQDIISSRSLTPLKSMVLDLHSILRSLIPNRPDLHDILSDEDLETLESKNSSISDSVRGTLNHFIRAGKALSKLESEDRATTTIQWIHVIDLILKKLGKVPDFSDIILDASFGIPPISYATLFVSSAAYLHHKADMCKVDVSNYHFSNVIAPKIQFGGKTFLRYDFESKHANFSSREQKTTSLRATYQWILQIVRSCDVSPSDLIHSEEARAESLLKTGWVDLVLFRAEDSSEVPSPSTQFILPEVLSLSLNTITNIRRITKVAVAGSALALHATTIAGVGEGTLKSDNLTESEAYCRKKLMMVLSNRIAGTQEEYENRVSKVVIDLAKVLNRQLTSHAASTLKHQSEAVLRGEDPVIKLLDNRMRKIFKAMMLWSSPSNERIPVKLKAGRPMIMTRINGDPEENHSKRSFKSLFQQAARNEFKSKGFAFYATELAQACLLATREINLVLDLYGNIFLEKMYGMVCSDESRIN